MNAYLDPGSGSMLLGLIASGMAGIVVFFKTFGRRVFSTLAFWRKDEPTADDVPAEQETSTQETASQTG
jgi:hypothetical protein